MASFRSQQYRWMKGTAENARMHAARIVTSKLPLRVKLHPCAHLFASTGYLLTLSLVLSTVLAALLSQASTGTLPTRYGLVMLIPTVTLTAVFYQAQGSGGLAGLLRFLPMMLAFLVFTMGMSLHNALAALAGWLGHTSEFVRTPKSGIIGTAGNWVTSYASASLGGIVWAEMALLAFLAAALVAGGRRADFSAYYKITFGSSVSSRMSSFRQRISR